MQITVLGSNYSYFAPELVEIDKAPTIESQDEPVRELIEFHIEKQPKSSTNKKESFFMK